LLLQAFPEAGQALRIALDLDGHAGRIVAHLTVQTQLVGQSIDKRPEADALHGTLDVQAPARQVFGCGAHSISRLSRKTSSPASSSSPMRPHCGQRQSVSDGS